MKNMKLQKRYEKYSKLWYTYTGCPFKTGLVAEIGQGEEMIAVRTDIDALPIEEQVKHEFTSKHHGVMHACGHDIHMASILATGTQLKRLKMN